MSLAALALREGKHRLHVDISEIARLKVGTGVQRVVRAILRELLAVTPGTFQIELIHADDCGKFRSANTWLSRQPDLSGLLHGTLDEPIDARAGDVLLRLDLALRQYPKCDGEIARLRAVGVTTAFVVYNLIPLTHPQFCQEEVIRSFKSWITSVVNHADLLLCISRSVAKEVSEWIHKRGIEPGKSPRIGWFHLGSDYYPSSSSSDMPHELAGTPGRPEAVPSFLMVGNLEPRKRHRLVLDAFDLLWAEDIDVALTIVGKRGWLVVDLLERLDHHVERGHGLFLLSDVGDEYLEEIYAASSALIAASAAEGFGIPIIEAARSGLPAIARDIPVFHEVARDGVIYFAGDPEKLSPPLRPFWNAELSRTWGERTQSSPTRGSKAQDACVRSSLAIGDSKGARRRSLR